MKYQYVIFLKTYLGLDIYRFAKILRYWFLLFIFIYSANAQIYNVHTSEKLFYVDFDGYEGIENIYKKGFDKKEVSNFGFGSFAVWSRQTFENTGSIPIDAVLYNPRPGIDYIDVYVYKNGTLESKSYMGHLRSPQNRGFYVRFSAFGLKLLPGEKAEVLIRHQNLHGIIDTQWIMKQKRDFETFCFYDTLFFGLLFGIFAVLIIYNTALYFSIRKKELLFYNAFAISILLG